MNSVYNPIKLYFILERMESLLENSEGSFIRFKDGGILFGLTKPMIKDPL